MQVSLVTDEVSADLYTALELASAWGLEQVELRGVGAGRYPRVGEDLREIVPRLVAEHEIEVVALSPGLFKFPYPDPNAPFSSFLWSAVQQAKALKAGQELLEDHLERLLPEAIEAATEIDCPIIGCFAFVPEVPRDVSGTDDDIPDEVAAVISEAGRRAAAAGLTIAVENEMSTWAATANATAKIVRATGEPNVGVVWDPANACFGGDDMSSPAPYRAVRDLVRLVHFKDVRRDTVSDQLEFCVEGMIDWPAQIAALLEDGYDGAISVETHMSPKVTSSQALVARLQGLLGGAASV